MRNQVTTFAVVAWLGFAWSLAAVEARAATRVELEVVTGPRADPTSAQTWLRTLQQTGADGVRIRGERTGDRAQIVNLGSAAAPNLRVVGIVNDRNQLELPGGTFGQQDIARLRDYIDRLRTQGIDGVTGARGPFGLTETQYTAVLADLRRPIHGATTGRRPAEVVQAITGTINLPTTIDAAAARALAAGEPATTEVDALSSGTGLAAVLGEYGLTATPRLAASGKVELIVGVAGAGESWPVGYPLEGLPADKLPALVKPIDVELRDVPLAEVLAAVQPEFAAPFLVDRRRLRAQNIDPEKAIVRHPRRQTVFGQVLQAVLTQSNLKYEIRQDEAGKVFVWITTIR
jgi:hypothetical protein